MSVVRVPPVLREEAYDDHRDASEEREHDRKQGRELVELESAEATMATVRRAVLADLSVLIEYNRRMALETEHKTLDPAVLRAGARAVPFVRASKISRPTDPARRSVSSGWRL